MGIHVVNVLYSFVKTIFLSYHTNFLLSTFHSSTFLSISILQIILFSYLTLWIYINIQTSSLFPNFSTYSIFSIFLISKILYLLFLYYVFMSFSFQKYSRHKCTLLTYQIYFLTSWISLYFKIASSFQLFIHYHYFLFYINIFWYIVFL